MKNNYEYASQLPEDFEKPEFSDVKFMTAAEKESVLKNFRTVIDKRSLEFIHKDLYIHLNCHCGFIAHYNIQGFRDAYSAPKDFLFFVEQFAGKYSFEMLFCPDYKDINTEMIKYAKANYEKIKQEMLHKEYEDDLSIIRLLAKKHNLSFTLAREE